MISVAKFAELGHAEHGWLDARHHFSFANYYNPARMGWGPLRVWNDDTIAPGTGFDPHPHKDMEIITYVRRGAITHRDNLGNEGRTAAGDVQVMTAGTGIAHSEFNLEDAATQLFQIWIEPRETGLTPNWSMARFPKPDRQGRLLPLASGETQMDGVLPINQDATLFGAALLAGQSVKHELREGRRAYLVAPVGRLQVNGIDIDARDGVSIENETCIELGAIEDTDIVLADLP